MRKLKKLVAQQKKDMNSRRVQPIIINSAKAKVFGEIPSERDRAIYILIKTNFSSRWVAKRFGISHSVVQDIAYQVEKELGNLKSCL